MELSIPKAAKPGTVEWHEENIEALKKSMAHWRRLRDLKQKKNEYVGCDWCACCELDNMRNKANPDDFPYNCDGCPIRDFTGKDACVGTPYPDAAAAWDSSREAGDVTSTERARMQAEVDFLKEVRRSEKCKLRALKLNRQGS